MTDKDILIEKLGRACRDIIVTQELRDGVTTIEERAVSAGRIHRAGGLVDYMKQLLKEIDSINGAN